LKGSIISTSRATNGNHVLENMNLQITFLIQTTTPNKYMFIQFCEANTARFNNNRSTSKRAYNSKAGKIAQWLRVLATFPENPGSVLSTHMIANSHL
ncbi:hypothetical protein ACQP3D_26050, partial [Escherichia coli]